MGVGVASAAMISVRVLGGFLGWVAIAIACAALCAPLVVDGAMPTLRHLELAARTLARGGALAAIVAAACATLAWPVARAVPATVLLAWAMVGSTARSLGVLALGVAPGSLAIVLAGLVGGLPWIALLLQMRLRTIDAAQLDAARNLGADAWARWRRIEWPIGRSALAFGALWVALQHTGDTATYELAGGGKMYSAALLLRDAALVDDARALASALLVLVVVLAVPLTIWVARGLAELVPKQAAVPTAASASPIGIAIATVALVPVLAVLPHATRAWSAADAMIASRIDATLGVVVVVALLAVVLGACAAITIPRRASALLLLPLVLPPTTYGLAALDVARIVGVAPGMFFTVLGTLPVAVALVFVACTLARPRVPQSLVDAAADLGAGPVARLRRIWAPRMGPVWIAAALLVGAYCWADAAIAPFTSGPGEGTVAVATVLAARGADAFAASRWAWVQIAATIVLVLAASWLWRERRRA